MPVNTLHPCVAEMIPSWEEVRDFAAGPRKVKAATTRYLPKLKSHMEPDKGYLYDRYLDRAVVLPVTRRTWLAFGGLAWRRPADVKVPDEAMLKDVTLTGVPFQQFARQAFMQLLAPGRVGLWTDMSPERPGVPQPARAYQRWCAPENVTYWREEPVEQLAERLRGVAHRAFLELELSEGTKITTHLRLREYVEEPDPDDFWKTRLVEQFRVVDLMDVPDVDGSLTVGEVHQRFRKREQASGDRPEDWYAYGDPIVPKRRGTPVPFIPFVPVNPMSIGFETEEPAFLGLAKLNQSHYQTSADLENARFKLGHPQLYAFGVQADDKLAIGDALWTSLNPAATCGAVQVADQFEGLRLALVEKQEQMVDEGARLMAKTEVSRTATEAKISRTGERSLLAIMTETASEGLSLALAYQAWWNDLRLRSLPEIRALVSVQINSSFEDEFLVGAEGEAWLRVQQGRGISKDTLLHLYHRSGVYPPGRTVAQEKRLIEMDRAAELESLDEDDGDDPIPGVIQ